MDDQEIITHIDRLVEEHPDTIVTVVIPEVVVRRWWQQILHNHSAFALKIRLVGNCLNEVRTYLSGLTAPR